MKRQSNKQHRKLKAEYKPMVQKEDCQEYIMANWKTRHEAYFMVDDTIDYDTAMNECLEFNRWSELDIVIYKRD